ncbi:DUF7283 family protein [Haloarcula marina]|uniref:DUF7283 family protein n=1 Tax=Haloarcula marina TaxID=2961574 RepID=UPI0020B7D7AE|nr:hypothetical protein [Halomicroarcula marina]
MFDTHVETLFVWAALGIASVAVFGVVAGLPTAAPPDAAALAATADEVATSPGGSAVTRDLSAEEWRLSANEVGLRNDGGTAHATFLTAIVPATGSDLRAVLDGRRPGTVFESSLAFEQACARAQTDGPGWRPAPNRATARRVVWGDVDVTLVG